MKINSDGSKRLGTLQTAKLLMIAKAQNIDTTELELAQLELDAKSANFVAIAKRTLDNKLKVRIEPDQPASDENTEVPFITDTYVSYLKRKNPTRSASVKQAVADALALKLANERNAKKVALKTALASVEYASPEYVEILDQIINM